jgi:hypothetical protein
MMRTTLPAKITDNPAFATAIQCASLGWLVFPLYGLSGDACQCRKGSECKSKGKHPRIVGYVEDASNDQAKLAEWARKWPASYWGVLCGPRSGVVAIDVDPRHGGVATLNTLESEHGKLPVTSKCNSGGKGGSHLFFEHPGKEYVVKNQVGGLGEGVDIKGDGGLVVLPGSIHYSRRRYAWADGLSPKRTPPAPLTDWLFQWIAEPVIERTEKREKVEAISLLSPFSALSALSITPDAGEDVARLVDLAIVSTTPSYPGNRNRLIFQFARHLKRIPQLANAEPAALPMSRSGTPPHSLSSTPGYSTRRGRTSCTAGRRSGIPWGLACLPTPSPPRTPRSHRPR